MALGMSSLLGVTGGDCRDDGTQFAHPCRSVSEAATACRILKSVALSSKPPLEYNGPSEAIQRSDPAPA